MKTIEEILEGHVYEEYSPEGSGAEIIDKDIVVASIKEYALQVLDEVEKYNLYNLQGGDIVTLKQKIQQLRKIIKEEL